LAGRSGSDIPLWFSLPEVLEELWRSRPPRSRQGFTVCGGGPSLPLEAVTARLIFRVFRWKELDGYGAPEACVTSAVDLAHASSTEQVDKLVRPEPCSRSQCHGGFSGAGSE
jgi:hypothetical protein